MKNRNLVIFFVLIILAGYGCNKLLDKSKQWNDSQNAARSISGYRAVGYPYNPANR